VARFSETGELLGSTYVGGAGNDSAAAVAVDAAGGILMAGHSAAAGMAAPEHRSAQRATSGGPGAFLARLEETAAGASTAGRRSSANLNRTQAVRPAVTGLSGCGAGYAQSVTLMINHAKIPNTDQVNFPVLVVGAAPALKILAAPGGQMTNRYGYDICFSADAAGSVSLAYERSRHDTSYGRITYWVNVPLVSHTVDTPIYVWYGNAAITSDQSNPAAVWDSNYKAVWHLNDNAASMTVADSTANVHAGKNQAFTNTRSGLGPIANVPALSYNGSLDHTDFVSPAGGDFDFTSGDFTFETWVKVNPYNEYAQFFGNGTWRANGYYFQNNGGGLQLSSNRSNAYSNYYDNATNYPVGVWRHVVVARTGPTLTIYANGAVDRSFSGFVGAASSGNAFTVGGSAGGNGQAFTGGLQEFRVSKIGRSGDWIAAEYNNQSSPGTFFSQIPWSTVGALPPRCNPGTGQSAKVGGSLSLDGSGSAPQDGGTTLTYMWMPVASTQPGMPSQSLPIFSTAKATVTGFVAGPINYQLSVKQGDGQSSSCVVHDGAVATDASGNVRVPNAGISQIVGPLTPWNPSTARWPWFETVSKTWADTFGGFQGSQNSYAYTKNWEIPGPGTCSGTHGSAMFTCTGVDTQARFCGGSGRITPLANTYITLWYTNPTTPNDGTPAKDQAKVVSCPSSTTVSRGGYIWNPASQANMQYSVLTDTDMSELYGQSANINYYDSVLAFYSMYYRTGIDSYLGYARWLADLWWHSPLLDQGNCDNGCVFPRIAALTGMYVRALDQDALAGVPGASPMWQGLYKLVLTGGFWSGWYSGDGASAAHVLGDLRESSYAAMFLALCGAFDPNVARASACRSTLNSNVTTGWTPQRWPDGAWRSQGGGTSRADTDYVTVAQGSTVVTATTKPFSPGMFPAEFMTANRFAKPSTIDSRIYTATYVDSNHLNISPAYVDDCTKLGGCSGRQWVFAQGSSAWVGPGVQPYMEGVAGVWFHFCSLALAEDPQYAANASACKSYLQDTVNWIVSKGVNAGQRGLNYGVGFGVCNPGTVANGCIYPDPPAARELTPEATAAFAFAYQDAPTPGLLSAIDNLFSAMFAKYSTDPGYDSNYANGIDAPNGWFYQTQNPKWLGFFWGMGRTASWLGARSIQ
jgi:hypothetical protein